MTGYFSIFSKTLSRGLIVLGFLSASVLADTSLTSRSSSLSPIILLSTRCREMVWSPPLIMNRLWPITRRWRVLNDSGAVWRPLI